MSEIAFNVDIQTSNGFGEFKNEVFTVRVDAETFDSAARRGVRKAMRRASAWNEAHEGAPQRPAFAEGYRVVGVRRADTPEFSAPSAVAGSPAVGQAVSKVVLTVEASGNLVVVHSDQN
ncbi:hypothetical protein [Nocardia nova]|uniref:hypothetical protein n=1 Tax=Nocardia nova TaxID=37330 RepID=UPI0033E24002